MILFSALRAKWVVSAPYGRQLRPTGANHGLTLVSSKRSFLQVGIRVSAVLGIISPLGAGYVGIRLAAGSRVGTGYVGIWRLVGRRTRVTVVTDVTADVRFIRYCSRNFSPQFRLRVRDRTRNHAGSVLSGCRGSPYR